MTLLVKMDDWNRLCDYFGLVHGSDIDLMLRGLDEFQSPQEYEAELERLENDFEDEEKEREEAEKERDKLQEKLNNIKRMLSDIEEELE